MTHGPPGGDKAAAEQKLLDKAMDDWPHVFTADRIWIFDRNFRGAARIARLMARTHVLIRLKSDIRLRMVSGIFPGGSYLAEISGDGATVTVRVIEYYVNAGGQDVPEMFCLVTDLEDWKEHPAADLAALYRWRWDGSRPPCARRSPPSPAPARPPGRCSARRPRTWSGRSSPPGRPPPG
jgi:hypothetical protein